MVAGVPGRAARRGTAGGRPGSPGATWLSIEGMTRSGNPELGTFLALETLSLGSHAAP
jgi:hypothetical protein